MITKVITASLSGIEGYKVIVETDMHRGLPSVNVAGLADTTIREAFQRVRPAIQNSGYIFPSERITVNLVPADKPKEGSHFDLPIALGIMMLGVDMIHSKDTGFLGEISLDGSVNPVRGVIPLVLALRKQNVRNIVLPKGNANEAAILKDVRIFPVDNLKDAADYMSGVIELEEYTCENFKRTRRDSIDFNQVIGQESVKRAIMLGVAGNHGILMMGGPGCGKSMMAKRIPTILPELSYEEMLEISGIYSVAGLLSDKNPVINQRPFRNPHHTITVKGLIGGGVKPRPGELSLAHRGILFLDELGEFESRTIDAMRQPIEEGKIRIKRNMDEYVFPSRVTIVIAANPCKCGNLWSENKPCTCTKKQLDSHKRKLMGPFADRIDMHIKVNSVDGGKLDEIERPYEWASSDDLRKSINIARKIQAERYNGTPYSYNGELDDFGIKKYCILDKEERQMLIEAYKKFDLSMRGYNKILKLSRTIADVEASEKIRSEHIAEAIMYRSTIS